MVLGSKKKFVVILLLLMASCLVEGDKHLYYFKLNLLWPNSYCNLGIKTCKRPIPQDFKVHGFWPRMANHQRPRQPSYGSYVNKEEVGKWNFSETLSSVWPNFLVGQKDSYFWQWAWNKDGIYSGMTAENYFYLAIQYANKYTNLYRSLMKSGVVTPSDQLYRQDILYGEISSILRTKPVIKCNNYKDVKQLSDVTICINTRGIAFDCPYTFVNCGDGEEKILFATEETVFLSRGIFGRNSANFRKERLT